MTNGKQLNKTESSIVKITKLDSKQELETHKLKTFNITRKYKINYYK